MTEKDINGRMKDVESAIDGQNKTLNHLSNSRLVFAVLFVLGLAAYIKEGLWLGLAGAAFALLAFTLLVVQFGRLKVKIGFLEANLSVLERYQKRHLGRWDQFEDDGADYRQMDPHKSDDLDLFGPHSLFQFLSVAHTMSGRSALARLLVHPNLNYVRERQHSVRELLNDVDFVIQFEAMAYEPNHRKRAREQEAEKALRAYAKGEGASMTAAFRYIGIVLPILTGVAILAAVLKILPFMVPMALFAIQMAVTILNAASINEQKIALLQFNRRLKGLQERLRLLNLQSFQSHYLKRMQDDIAGCETHIKRLDKLVSLWSLRENFLLYFPLCGLLAWDFNCLWAIERWRKVHGEDFNRWLNWIGEVEALISLGTIGRIRSDAVMAEIKEGDEPYLAMTAATHPLLNPQRAVTNDYAQGGETVIITGSNMSGKSTFMRTIGLNAVLAYAGGVVCAKSFVISPMHILTSMRVKDDVSEGISTFYGEILRIKEMADFSKKRVPVMVLIDEIFKGTNSADRIIGAEMAIRRLSKPWMMTVVTTHDFELCTLVDSDQVKGRNVHFEEHYSKNQILFDYKIRSGRCHTTNAQALMRLAGLLDDEAIKAGE